MSRRLSTALLLALSGALFACSDGTSPPATASVTIVPESASVAVGGSVTLTATLKDPRGRAIAGRSVVWTSANPAVATVDPAGVVTAIAAGQAGISATADGKIGSAIVNVLAPVAHVALSLPGDAPPRVGLGQTVQMIAVLTDSAGDTLSGRAISWTSTATNVAAVTGVGQVTGATAGTATITATSEGRAAAVALTVTSAPAPSIASVSPAVLSPGTAIRIAGTNFDTASAGAGDTVVVGGLRARVTAVTATEIDATLPDAYDCRPTQAAWIVVTTAAGSGTWQQTLQVSTPAMLAVGQTAVLTDQLTRCVELPTASGRYIVDVMNVTTVPSAITTFQLRGLTSAVPSAAAAASPARLPSVTPFAPPGAVLLGPVRRRAVQVHLAMLERNRRLMRRLGSPLAALRSLSRTTSGARVAAARSTAAFDSTATWNGMVVPLTVGATATFKYRPPSYEGCDSGVTVSARVAYVGAHSVIVEEPGGPFTGRMDSDYATLGRTFDDQIFPMLHANFGDPLVLDSLLDHNQRIVMFFTKRINDEQNGAIAYVASCDFYPATMAGAAGSNAGELFYGRVPVDSSKNYLDTDTRVGWAYGMKAVLAHESKHIVSMAEHIALDADDWEESWLEEGTAQIATEIWARTLYGPNATWKGNARYAATVGCDVRPGTCGTAEGTYDLFAWLYQYYMENQTKTFFNASDVDATVYGSGWFFARWAADNYAASEGAFFQAITQSPHEFGLANVAARTGRPYPEMLANFTLALATDDLPGLTPAAPAAYTFPSWNMADIWSGFAADFRVPVPAIAHPVSFGAFTQTVTALNGGAAAVFDISGSAAAGKQLVGLYTESGGALPAQSPLRLAILRVQ